MDIGCHLPTQGPLATREALVTFAQEAEKRQRRLALGQRPRHLSAPGDGQLSRRPLSASARQAPTSSRWWRSPRPPCAPRARGSAPRCSSWATAIPWSWPRCSRASTRCPTAGSSAGSAWAGGRRSSRSSGAPFHARGRQADEILRVFKALWTEENPSFAGEFFRFSDIGFAPKPVQKPHPPIWVGGDSPGAFRRVVTLGDGLARHLEDAGRAQGGARRLRAAAEAARRPFESIELSLRYRSDRCAPRPGSAGGRGRARRVQASRLEPRAHRLPPRRSRQDARAARSGHGHHPPRRQSSLKRR